MIAFFLHLIILTSDKLQRYVFSTSDDINIRQARLPKWEVHKNIVKKSGQAQLTYSVLAHT